MAQFQLSEDEFVRGSLVLAWKPRTIAMFVIALALIIASLAFKGHSLFESVVYPVIGIAALVGAAFLLSRYRLKKIFREQASLAELIHVTIDDEQLNYSWARGSFILPWANVRRGRETKSFFILWESSAFARILPKRVLSAEETAIIRKNIAARRLTLNKRVTSLIFMT